MDYHEETTYDHTVSSLEESAVASINWTDEKEETRDRAAGSVEIWPLTPHAGSVDLHRGRMRHMKDRASCNGSLQLAEFQTLVPCVSDAARL